LKRGGGSNREGSFRLRRLVNIPHQLFIGRWRRRCDDCIGAAVSLAYFFLPFRRCRSGNPAISVREASWGESRRRWRLPRDGRLSAALGASPVSMEMTRPAVWVSTNSCMCSDLNRNIDARGLRCQAAINSRGANCPASPCHPTYKRSPPIRHHDLTITSILTASRNV